MAVTLASFLSFFGRTGAQLIDAQDLTKLANYTIGANTGVTAQAGGAQAGSPVMQYSFNDVTVIASANDSVQLPPALPGAYVVVNAQGANTLRIYAGIAPNVQNGNVVDQIIAHGSTALTANGTAITIASGHTSDFVCTTIGQWKQQSDNS